MRKPRNNRFLLPLIAVLCLGMACFAAASPSAGTTERVPVNAENDAVPTPTPTPYTRIIPKDSTKKYNSPASDKSALVQRLPLIRVDGEIESAWSVCESYELANPVFGQSGASAAFRAFADDEKLYLCIEVKDATPQTSGEIATRSDCVEIFLNEDGEKPERYHAGDSHYIFIRSGACEERSGADVRLLQYVTVPSDDGYVIEMALQWTIPPEDRGDFIGFDIRVNDSQGEGTRDYIVQWSDTSMMTHENLSQVGTLYCR